MTIAHLTGNQHSVVIGPLVRIYACGLKLDQNVVETTVSRTKGASAAFIKELMRRAAQFHLQSGSCGHLQPAERNSAWEEILLGGGSLNLKLLGAANMAHETVR